MGPGGEGGKDTREEGKKAEEKGEGEGLVDKSPGGCSRKVCRMKPPKGSIVGD